MIIIKIIIWAASLVIKSELWREITTLVPPRVARAIDKQYAKLMAQWIAWYLIFFCVQISSFIIIFSFDLNIKGIIKTNIFPIAIEKLSIIWFTCLKEMIYQWKKKPLVL